MNIGKMISIIARQNQMYLVKEMNKIGITGSEYIFIANIPDEGTVIQQEICNELELDPGFATRSVKSLINKGYVVKVKNQQDKRAYNLKLSKRGLLKKKLVLEKLDYWNEVVAGNMTDIEIEKMFCNLIEIKKRIRNELNKDNKTNA